MKSTFNKRTPNTVNLTVKRLYLTEREVERLMDCARKHGRYGHRDATMILVAYRHGLRASEVCDLQWQQIELSEGRVHVHRVKNGISSVHPIRGDEMRALRKLRREYPKDAYVFVSERGGPKSAPSVSTASSSASARLPTCHSRSTPTCFAMPADSSSPMTATTRRALLEELTTGWRGWGHAPGGDGTLRFLGRSRAPTAVSPWSSSGFGSLRFGWSSSMGPGKAAVSALASITFVPSAACAASIDLTYSMVASNSSSDIFLRVLLYSTLCSRGTR
jgi:hypothetical protein